MSKRVKGSQRPLGLGRPCRRTVLATCRGADFDGWGAAHGSSRALTSCVLSFDTAFSLRFVWAHGVWVVGRRRTARSASVWRNFRLVLDDLALRVYVSNNVASYKLSCVRSGTFPDRCICPTPPSALCLSPGPLTNERTITAVCLVSTGFRLTCFAARSLLFPGVSQALINVVDAMLSQRTMGAETALLALDALATAALCPLVRAAKAGCARCGHSWYQSTAVFLPSYRPPLFLNKHLNQQFFHQVYPELCRPGSNNSTGSGSGGGSGSSGGNQPSSSTTPRSLGGAEDSSPPAQPSPPGGAASATGGGRNTGSRAWSRRNRGSPGRDGGGGGSGSGRGSGRRPGGVAPASARSIPPRNRLGVDVLLDAAGGVRQKDPGVMCAALKV